MIGHAGLALALALVLAAPLRAQSMWCLLDGVMLTTKEATAQLDYLGDGTFEFTPKTPEIGFGFQRSTLKTAGGPIPVFLDEKPCTAFSVTWPVTVELAVRSADGPRIYSGCCRWAAP